jgi:hypothetical protein
MGRLTNIAGLADLRARLAEIEPWLIDAACRAGATWDQLAPVLGADKISRPREAWRWPGPAGEGSGFVVDFNVVAGGDLDHPAVSPAAGAGRWRSVSARSRLRPG